MSGTTMKTLFLLAVALHGAAALAHDGHGLAGSHWHATDAFGLVAIVGAAAVAWWWSRRR
jgi:hypothetical protein